MARILKARRVPGEGRLVVLDGDELEHAEVSDYYVEPSSRKDSVMIVLTRSGHFPTGIILNMGGYKNLESLAGLVVEKLNGV